MRILRTLFKIVLGLLVTLLLLLGLAVGGLYYALNKPELTIPEKPLRWAVEHILKPLDILVSFKKLELTILQTSGSDWYQRQILVRGEELKVAMPELFRTELPDLDLRSVINFHPKRYGVKTVGPIDLSGATVWVRLPKPDPRKQSEPFDTQLWLDRLRKTRFEPIRLGLQSLVIERPDAPTMQARIVANLVREPGNHWVLGVRADRMKNLFAQKASFDLRVDLPESDQLLPLGLALKGRADLEKLGWAQLTGEGRLEREDKGSLQLKLISNVDRQRQLLNASARLDGEAFGIKLNGEALHPVDALQQVAVKGCELAGSIRQKSRPFMQANLDCKVALTRVPAPAEKPFQDMLPKDFEFQIKGPVEIANWDKKPVFEAPLRIVLTPLNSEFYTLRGSTSIKFSGEVLGGLQGLNADIDVDTQLSLDRFQPVVRRLARSDFAVPAPFNTLDGRIYCNVQGRIKRLGAVMNLPLECGTELMSETQALFVKANGTVEKEPDKKPVIHLAVGLNQVTFELPKLALNGQVPRIFPDKRIMTAEEQAAEQAKLKAGPSALPVILDIRITTPAERPLRLVTGLQPTPVPISIDLSLKGDQIQPTGFVGIHDYRVTVLKQKAFVDHFRLVMSKDEEQPQLDGLVVFQDPDVKINFKVSGTIDRPFYQLESVPPRSPTELLSIVLYGGDAEALDEDNLRTVDETRAAMVDGAIGLLSMYYLASTPIDSVGYNPHTGLFRARVKMGPGLSLTLGSDLGGSRQSIALRKRLTENWSFETGAETDEETKQSKGVAMFKWSRRY